MESAYRLKRDSAIDLDFVGVSIVVLEEDVHDDIV